MAHQYTQSSIAGNQRQGKLTTKEWLQAQNEGYQTYSVQMGVFHWTAPKEDKTLRFFVDYWEQTLVTTVH